MSYLPLKPRIPVLNRNNPFTNGLIFCVPFFEKTGTKLFDVSSKSTGNLTNQNGSTWTNNLIGTGITFNGTNGYVDYGNNAIFNNLTKFTISVWVKFVTGAGNDRTIFSKNSSDIICTFWLRFTSLDGKVRFVVAATALTSNTTLTSGNIYNLTATYDMVNMRSYINGMLDTTQGNTSTPSVVATIASIGAKTGGTGDFFNSDIYSVLLWNRCLSNQEIKQLYYNPWQIYQTYPMYKKRNYIFARTPAAASTARTAYWRPLMGVGF